MIRNVRFSLVLLMGALAMLAGEPCAHAANTKEKLKQLEAQLGQQKQKQAALERAAAEASEGLKGLREKLIAATEALQAKGEEQDRISEHLDQLEEDIDAKKTALAIEKKNLDALTSALIELSRQPHEADFLQTSLTTDHIHRAILLRAVLPKIREQTDSIAADIITLREMQGQMDQQEKLLEASQHNLEGQQHDLDQLIKSRQGLLQRTEAQKSAIALQLVSLSGEATNLRQLLDKVTPKRAPRAAPDSPGVKMLRAPVSGAIIHPFGSRDADGVMSEGITYAALPGAPVVAPQAGKVVFAGPFRGYGEVLILQHDGGMHSFLAGFGRIDAEMGQDVAAGEPLGVLPVRAGGDGGKGRDRPELYFEWRRNNEPVNPAGDGITLSKSP